MYSIALFYIFIHSLHIGIFFKSTFIYSKEIREVEIPYSKSDCGLLVFSHKNDSIVILLLDPKTRFLSHAMKMNTRLKRENAGGVC